MSYDNINIYKNAQNPESNAATITPEKYIILLISQFFHFYEQCQFAGHFETFLS